MDTKQIIKKKIYGDYIVVSQILTKKLNRYISPSNARMMVERENATHHNDAICALRQVVEARNKILEES